MILIRLIPGEPTLIPASKVKKAVVKIRKVERRG